MTIEYRMDDEIYQYKQEVLGKSLIVSAYAHDEFAGKIEKPVRELQKF